MSLPKKIYGRVHCHICPLKEVCEDADTESSFRLNHLPEFTEDNVRFPLMDKMEDATRHCVLRKLLMERLEK